MTREEARNPSSFGMSGVFYFDSLCDIRGKIFKVFSRRICLNIINELEAQFYVMGSGCYSVIANIDDYEISCIYSDKMPGGEIVTVVNGKEFRYVIED